MLEILFRKLICGSSGRNDIILVISEINNNLFHSFDAGVMLEVIIKHFEDKFEKGEEIFIGFEFFVVGRKPIIQDTNIDHPDNVIEEIGNAGYSMFKD